MSPTQQHLSGHARLYATCIGMVMFVAGVMGALALVAQLQLRTLGKAQTMLMERIEQIAHETSGLLDKLNADFEPECSQENLVRLRHLMFDTRFVRDIGLLDGNGAVYCTTGAGRWEKPFTPRREQLHARPSPSGATRYTQFDTPTRIGGGRQRTTIIWQGGFNLVVDPFATDGVYNRQRQTAWFVTPDGALQPVGQVPGAALPEALQALLRTRAQGAAAGPSAHYAWREKVFLRTELTRSSRLIVQTHIPLAAALDEHAPTLAMLVGFSALLGILTGVLSLQRLMHMGTLDARIGELLGPAHLRCVYQPIVDIHTGAPVGCEVLMRIQDGAETLMPDTTIPAIMRRGLTWELDRAVILHGLQELLSCTLPPGGFKVAFNLFPQNIRFSEIDALLSPLRSRFEAAGLEVDLEVTEHNYDHGVIAEVDRLRAAGYQVSVDDFGTGYSNLGSIKRFAPKYLKIDKSFVFDMEDASIRSSLIPEIVGIGTAVGALIIAEGVENIRQVEQLRACGVRYAQGYFYARPLPLEAFRQYLASAGAGPASAG